MSFLVEYTDPQWRDLNMRALRADEAYMYLQSHYEEPSYLYTLSDECYTVCVSCFNFPATFQAASFNYVVPCFIFCCSKCPYTKVKALPAAAASLEPLKLSSAYALSFKIYAHDQGHYAYDNV